MSASPTALGVSRESEPVQADVDCSIAWVDTVAVYLPDSKLAIMQTSGSESVTIILGFGGT